MSSPGVIQYNYGALAALEGELRADFTRIEQQLTDLENYLRPLVAGDGESQWRGRSGASFQQLQQQWRTSFNELNAILGRMPTAIRQSAENMQQRDAANARLFNG